MWQILFHFYYFIPFIYKLSERLQRFIFIKRCQTFRMLHQVPITVIKFKLAVFIWLDLVFKDLQWGFRLSKHEFIGQFLLIRTVNWNLTLIPWKVIATKTNLERNWIINRLEFLLTQLLTFDWCNCLSMWGVLAKSRRTQWFLTWSYLMN